MTPLSYLSRKAEVRESKIHGHGLFAMTDITKGEIVASKAGTLLIERLCVKKSRLCSARWKFRSVMTSSSRR
jgi:hypothetical protein